jgi:hypothetical protein
MKRAVRQTWGSLILHRPHKPSSRAAIFEDAVQGRPAGRHVVFASSSRRVVAENRRALPRRASSPFARRAPRPRRCADRAHRRGPAVSSHADRRRPSVARVRDGTRNRRRHAFGIRDSALASTSTRERRPLGWVRRPGGIRIGGRGFYPATNGTIANAPRSMRSTLTASHSPSPIAPAGTRRASRSARRGSARQQRLWTMRPG